MMLPQNQPHIPVQPHPDLTTGNNVLLVDLDPMLFEYAWSLPGSGEEMAPQDIILGFYDYIRNKVRFLEERLLSNNTLLFLSSSTNFRKAICTDRPYKGNRGGKPVVVTFLRNVLLGMPPGPKPDLGYSIFIKPYEGFEADDMIATCSKRLLSVIVVSVDKDFQQLTCPLYTYPVGNRPEKFRQEVSNFEALKNLMTQVLTGDTVDNYAGCPGIGAVKAAKILQDCKTEDDLYQAVFSAPFQKPSHIFEMVNLARLQTNAPRLELLTPENYARLF